MDTKTTNRLSDFYYGIIAYGRVSYQFFGVIDFAGLAASAINVMIKRGELYSWDKEDAYKFMVNCFNRDIGGRMSTSDINQVVDYMRSYSGVDKNLAGIMAVMEMAK